MQIFSPRFARQYMNILYNYLYVYSFTCTAWLNGITVGKPMCALKIRYIYLKKQKNNSMETL